LDYGVQRCQITEVAFYTKLLVNDILAGLERILDYAGVGLERSDSNCSGLSVTHRVTRIFHVKGILKCVHGNRFFHHFPTKYSSVIEGFGLVGKTIMAT